MQSVLQSVLLRGITAKTCTYSRLHAYNCRSKTRNLFTYIMRNKYYSRILCKQQLKQVLPGLTNFKPQEQHITNYFQHIFNLTRQQNMCQNIFCYTSTCISSIVLTYCCVIKMYILCHSAAQKPSQILPNIDFFFCAVHVQWYPMLHSSNWVSLPLIPHCEPHDLQCDVNSFGIWTWKLLWLGTNPRLDQ